MPSPLVDKSYRSVSLGPEVHTAEPVFYGADPDQIKYAENLTDIEEVCEQIILHFLEQPNFKIETHHIHHYFHDELNVDLTLWKSVGKELLMESEIIEREKVLSIKTPDIFHLRLKSPIKGPMPAYITKRVIEKATEKNSE